MPEGILKQSLTCLYVVLLNRYSRRYFLSFDKKFRITNDEGICYYGMNNLGAVSESISAKDPDMVLELKYDKEHAPFAEQISTLFPFRVTKNSKYMRGIECTCF